MKTLILFLLTFLFFSCNDQTNASSNPTSQFTIDKIDANFVVYKILPNAKVQEFYLIQGVDTSLKILDIVEVSYNEGANITLKAGNKNYVFSVDDSNSIMVHGIAYYKILNNNGLDKQMLTQKLTANLNTIVDSCNTECKCGGMGATRTEYTLNKRSCGVSCADGYYACIGDVSVFEIRCIRNCSELK